MGESIGNDYVDPMVGHVDYMQHYVAYIDVSLSITISCAMVDWWGDAFDTFAIRD
jgi:hypothetical protein